MRKPQFRVIGEKHIQALRLASKLILVLEGGTLKYLISVLYMTSNE